MDFILSPVTSDAEFLRVFPLMWSLVEEEKNPFVVTLSSEQALAAWKKAASYGYTVYQALDVEGTLLAVFGLTELFDPLSIKPAFRLNNFVVDPNFRNRGIGRQIMQRIEEIAKKADGQFLLLEVFPDNERAIRFYTTVLNYEYLCNRMIKNLGNSNK